MGCPFCKSNYTTASGLIHHLERGSCPSAPSLNRESIHRIIRQRDPNNVITKKQIGWHEEGTVSVSATNAAYNGRYWVCYICKKQFSNVSNLNAHLNSPVHKQKVYHCPNWRDCSKEFSTLAALFNHLESESCYFMRFESVQEHAGNVLQGRNLISFG